MVNNRTFLSPVPFDFVKPFPLLGLTSWRWRTKVLTVISVFLILYRNYFPIRVSNYGTHRNLLLHMIILITGSSKLLFWSVKRVEPLSYVSEVKITKPCWPVSIGKGISLGVGHGICLNYVLLWVWILHSYNFFLENSET